MKCPNILKRNCKILLLIFGALLFMTAVMLMFREYHFTTPQATMMRNTLYLFKDISLTQPMIPSGVDAGGKTLNPYFLPTYLLFLAFGRQALQIPMLWTVEALLPGSTAPNFLVFAIMNIMAMAIGLYYAYKLSTYLFKDRTYIYVILSLLLSAPFCIIWRVPYHYDLLQAVSFGFATWYYFARFLDRDILSGFEGFLFCLFFLLYISCSPEFAIILFFMFAYAIYAKRLKDFIFSKYSLLTWSFLFFLSAVYVVTRFFPSTTEVVLISKLLNKLFGVYTDQERHSRSLLYISQLVYSYFIHVILVITGLLIAIIKFRTTHKLVLVLGFFALLIIFLYSIHGETIVYLYMCIMPASLVSGFTLARLSPFLRNSMLCIMAFIFFSNLITYDYQIFWPYKMTTTPETRYMAAADLLLETSPEIVALKQKIAATKYRMVRKFDDQLSAHICAPYNLAKLMSDLLRLDISTPKNTDLVDDSDCFNPKVATSTSPYYYVVTGEDQHFPETVTFLASLPHAAITIVQDEFGRMLLVGKVGKDVTSGERIQTLDASPLFENYLDKYYHNDFFSRIIPYHEHF